MRINKKVVLSVAMAGVLTASPLYAQFFSNNVSAQRTEEQVQQKAVSGANQQYAQPATAQQPTQQYQQQGYNPAYGTQQQAYSAQQRQQQPQAKTRQNASQKGKTTVVNTGKGGITFSKNDKKQDQELIMMYMKDFNVYRSPSGQTRCSMQFAVVTTLPTKVSNISYRLKWPQMETVLSFSNIQPYVENHFNYS